MPNPFSVRSICSGVPCDGRAKGLLEAEEQLYGGASDARRASALPSRGKDCREIPDAGAVATDPQ